MLQVSTYGDFLFLCNLSGTILSDFWNKNELKENLQLIKDYLHLDQQCPPLVHFPLTVLTLDINILQEGFPSILTLPQLK